MSSGVKSSTKVTSYSSPGGGSSMSSSRSYSSKGSRPISQAKGTRFSMGGGGGGRYSSRSSYGGGMGMGGGMIVRSYESGVSSANPSGFTNVTTEGVKQVLNSRSTEKKDMQDLNERFAGYIEKVRFLEAQNKKLSSELVELKEKWGVPAEKIKEMYEAELKQCRELHDEAAKERDALGVKNQSLNDQLEEANIRIEELEAQVKEWQDENKKKDSQISDQIAQLALLNSRVDSLERIQSELTNDNARLNESLLNTRRDLDNEVLLRIDAENRVQSLEEEIEFMRRIHEEELRDLAALAYRDTTEENRAYWDNELKQVMRDLSEEYDNKVANMKLQLEGFYNMKMQEFRTGSARRDGEVDRLTEINRVQSSRFDDLQNRLDVAEAELAKFKKKYLDLVKEYETKQAEWDMELLSLKQENADLRQALSDQVEEVQKIMDAKLSLELEIACYRKLLQGEESRIGEGYGGGMGGGMGGGFSFAMSGGGGGGGSGSGFGGGSGGGSGGGFGSGGGDDNSGISSSLTSTTVRSTSAAPDASLSLDANASSGKSTTSSSETSSSSGGMTGTTKTTTTKKVQQVMKGEMSAKTTYARTAKGPLSISNTGKLGEFVEIENSSKTEDLRLDGYSIRRNTDGNNVIFKIPNGIVLKSSKDPNGCKIKIFKKGGKSAKDSKAKDIDIECEMENWGNGQQIVTVLVDPKNEDKATHTQKTVFQTGN